MSEELIYILPQSDASRPLTARNLQDWALCPRKYLLSFFEPRGSIRRFLGGPAALGQALRQTVIELHRRGGAGAVEASQLSELFEIHWDASLCADSLEEEQLHADGLRLLADYYAQAAELAAHVRQVDVRMEAQIGDFSFVAVADRVDGLPGAPMRLVRLTSARRSPSAAELAEQTSALLLLLVGCRHFGASDLTVGYHCLRSGRLVIPQIPEAALAAFEARLLRQATAMRRDIEFPPNKGKQCRWCRSKSQCPAWQKHSH